MAISVINNLSMNRSDAAVAADVWTATSATASDFQAPAGSDYVLIKGTAMTASAYLDLTDVFSATYDNYLIRWNGLVKSVDGLPYIGFLDSSDVHMGSGTYYTKAVNLYANWTTATVAGGVDSNANGYYVAEGWYWNDAARVQTGEMQIWNPLATGTYYPTVFFKSTFIQATHPGLTLGIGYFDNNSDAKYGIRFGISAGTFTENGNVAVYGIKYT